MTHKPRYTLAERELQRQLKPIVWKRADFWMLIFIVLFGLANLFLNLLAII